MTTMMKAFICKKRNLILTFVMKKFDTLTFISCIGIIYNFLGLLLNM
jgi:hypothetical protein